MSLESIRDKEGGSQVPGCMYTRGGGGGHSGEYRVQHGAWGGLKVGGKCVCS